MIARKELPTYTYADYVNWKGDWELIEGIPYAMGSAKGTHQYIAMQLSGQIWNQLSACPKCNVYADLDWIISDTTVFRPDLFIFCGHRIDEYLRKTPQFIVEILSKNTAGKDKGVKFRIYQEKKVPYYLIINADTKTVTIYELQEGKYEPIAVLSTEKHSFFLPDCNFEIDFGKIW